jgi:hypothetical protein
VSLLDAYATIDEYTARTGDKTTSPNATLTAQLLGTSRLLERDLELMPGAFNSAASQVIYVDGHGGTRLWLRDTRGLGFFVQSIDANGIGIDSENDGTYDGYALDLADAWVVGNGTNDPHTRLDLLPWVTAATVSAWPDRPRAVKLTCTTGYAAVPPMIVDLVCHRTYELRESMKDGGAGVLPGFDGGTPMRPQTAWLWKNAEAMYGRRLPV